METVQPSVHEEESTARVRERFAIDIEGATRALAEIDEARLGRETKGEKMRFLSPAQLPVGVSVLKILPPWTTQPPHAGRFWRAVWVHFGLGPAGETKTALCPRRMNRQGLPRRRGEETMGPCPVCDALEPLWKVRADDRTADEKKALADFRPRLSYLFNAVLIRAAAKSHIEDGTHVFTCSPNLGEPILTAFKFVLSMKPDTVPDNFDVQLKKRPAESKFFAGRQVYEYTEVFPSFPAVELDLADSRFERYALDSLYRPKDAATIESLWQQTGMPARLTGAAPGTTGSERPPFEHRPAGADGASRQPGQDDLSPEEERLLASLTARARAREGAAPIPF